MDDIVARSIAKWPDVPAVYGWLELDRRGNWRIKGEKIANVALRDFIARNYDADSRGCWFFQNGPQRVYISLAYTPWVVHYEGDSVLDHCGRPFAVQELYLDEEGSVLVVDEKKVALLDDRDLARFAESGARLPRLTRAEIPARFGFVAQPADSLR
jgi:hypothetical protein